MARISSKALNGAPENKKKFTSQLFDDDLGWNTYQMKFRTMDPQIGRFLQIDPLAPQYAHNSTYAYAENDVIRAIDLEGLEKFIITNRSFHPDATFGGGYSGDARNFTTQENKYTTSRIEQKVNIDFTAKTYSANVRSDESHYPALGLTDKATPTQKFEQADFSNNPNGTKSFDLKTSYAGDNPLFPGKVDMIDVKTNISLTITGKDNQFLAVGANMKGDNFPAAESFIKDANGTAVFIGVAPIPKGGNVTDIIDNNNRPMFTTGFTIELNKAGNFSGKVIYDGVKYPIAQWNKFYEETPTKK